MQTIYRTFDGATCDFISKSFDLTSSIKEQLTNEEVQFELQKFIYITMNSPIFDKGDEQSTAPSMANRYELHKVLSDNGTSIFRGYSNKNDLIEKKRLVAIIQNCYFEAGIWSEADEFFEGLGKRCGSIDHSLRIMSDIVNHNLSNDHILEGALHILSNYSYDQLDPYGITISIACAVNHSPVIQDLLISCFEKWNSREAIDILESLNLTEPWLMDYRDEVVEQLKCKETSA